MVADNSAGLWSNNVLMQQVFQIREKHSVAMSCNVLKRSQYAHNSV